MRGVAENDGTNALVLAGGLMWRDVASDPLHLALFAADSVPYSQDTCGRRCASTRRSRPRSRAVPHTLRSAHDAREGGSAAGAKAAALAEIETALAAVESLDEDRIVRHFVNACSRRSAPTSIRSTMPASRGR